MNKFKFPQASREQLVKAIATKNDLTKAQANFVIKAFCEGFEDLLAEGYHGVSLPKYFSLSVNELEFKDRYNISSKTKAKKKFKRFYFKPSKRWKKLINSR